MLGEEEESSSNLLPPARTKDGMKSHPRLGESEHVDAYVQSGQLADLLAQTTNSPVSSDTTATELAHGDRRGSSGYSERA